MPSESSDFVGVKVSTVAPHNAAIGRERIQGVYVLMDAATPGLIAIFDAAALTLRTPAVSAGVTDELAPVRVARELPSALIKRDDTDVLGGYLVIEDTAGADRHDVANANAEIAGGANGQTVLEQPYAVGHQIASREVELTLINFHLAHPPSPIRCTRYVRRFLYG